MMDDGEEKMGKKKRKKSLEKPETNNDLNQKEWEDRE